MLSKSKIKQIRSMELKKFRNELNAFVAEGNKLVAAMLHAFECDLLIAKPSWMATQGDIPAKELLEADDDDIRKASFLKNPQEDVYKRQTFVSFRLQRGRNIRYAHLQIHLHYFGKVQVAGATLLATHTTEGEKSKQADNR